MLFSFCIAFFECSAKDYPASLFGIYSDGITLNTRSIQFAIDYINQQGGGRLVFDVGRFLTGSIHLRSHVTLQLLEGAVLVGVLNPLDYDRDGFTALILANGQQNIGIIGSGIIDGQGRTVARNVEELVHKGLIKDSFRNDRPEVEIRPMLVYFRSCKNVSIKGITLQNAAAWVQTYDQCQQLTIDSIRVNSRAFWNNDGLDIVDCDGVRISHAYIDAADDGICFKSHDPASMCRNVVVHDCIIRSSASAIKMGTASLGGFQNIHIKNIRVYDTYRSALALEAVDGGWIKDVEADSVQVVNSGNGIFLRIGERINGKIGGLENIKISHVSIAIARNKPDSGYEYEGPVEDMPRNISPAVVIAGLPGAMITNVFLNDIQLQHPGGANPEFAKVLLNQLDSVAEKPASYPEFSMFHELPAWAIYIRHAKNIQVTNSSFSCLRKDYRTGIVLDDVHDSHFTSLKVQDAGNKKPFYQYRCSQNVIR